MVSGLVWGDVGAVRFEFFPALVAAFGREVRGAQDRSATHNSANLPDYLDFGVYHT